MIRLVTALFLIMYTVDLSAGQLINTTEPKAMGLYTSDYQYEDIGPYNSTDGSSLTTPQNMTSGLHGEVLTKQSNHEMTGNPRDNTRSISDGTRTLTEIYPDYTEGEYGFPDVGTRLKPEILWSHSPFAFPHPGVDINQARQLTNFKRGYMPDTLTVWNNHALAESDMMELLHRQFLIIEHYGLLSRLEDLQKMYPNINIQQMYDYFLQQSRASRRFNSFERLYRGEDSPGYWHNGTFRYYRYNPEEVGYEADEGFWYNGTFYPNLDEVLEDGFWHNGTFYPTDIERPDFEDGFVLNGTFYHLEDYEDSYTMGGFNSMDWPGDMGELGDREDMMWWQLHHPRWEDRTNNVGHPRSSDSKTGAPSGLPFHLTSRKPFSLGSAGQDSMRANQGSTRQWFGNGFNPGWRNRNFSPHPYQTRWRNKIYERRYRLRPKQTNQRTKNDMPRPRLQDGYTQRRGPRINSRMNPNVNVQTRQHRDPPRLIDIDPIFAKYRQSLNYPGNFRPGQRLMGASSPQSLAVAQSKKVSRKASSPLDPYRSDSTVAIGITIACIIGLILILGPLICMLNNYRHNKRIKKRTFLRRPELSASVEEGLIDTMVHTELDAAGGAPESLTFGAKSPHGGYSGSPAAVRAKTMGPREKKWKERKTTKGNLSGKIRGGKGEWTRQLQKDLEMTEMRRDRRAKDKAITPLAKPSSGSFSLNHQRYAPRNITNGTTDGAEGHSCSSMPLSVVGMDSEDEIKIVGK